MPDGQASMVDHMYKGDLRPEEMSYSSRKKET